MAEPLLTFKSHIEGRNADVAIYSDRVEWAKAHWSLGKIAMGIVTGGTSMLVTGTQGAKDFEVIPVKAISSVRSQRDGLLYSKVSVICSDNTIDFRVSHSDKPSIQSLLTSLILGNHPSQAQPFQNAVPLPSRSDTPIDIPEQLKKLGALKDAGVLTDAEFQAKKTELLARL
jgi:hypothetical protein